MGGRGMWVSLRERGRVGMMGGGDESVEGVGRGDGEPLPMGGEAVEEAEVGDEVGSAVSEGEGEE